MRKGFLKLAIWMGGAWVIVTPSSQPEVCSPPGSGEGEQLGLPEGELNGEGAT